MEAIIDPISVEALEAELTNEKLARKSNNGSNLIYIITHQNSPLVMKEIGRLRELTFREAGGGTGKPIDIDEFRHIEKKIFAKANLGIEQKTLPSAPSNSTNGPSILFLPKLGGKEAINIEDIIYCKASNNYTEIILKGKIKKVISKTLKATESMLVDFPYFYRVHDSYLVNYRCIEEFRNEGEGGMLNLTEGHSVDISKRRKADFLLFLKSTGVKFN